MDKIVFKTIRGTEAASIVVIDDHDLIRHLLCKVVEDEPALRLVGNFANAVDGIAGCLTLNPAPALVIIDWMLPDGQGIDVVRALAPKLPGTRYLFLSTAEKEHIVREAIAAGVHGFVMKRSSYETFLEAIRQVVAGSKYYCAISSRLLVEALIPADAEASQVLNPRECEIVRSIARGESVKTIAFRLGLSPKTINNQYSCLKEKLGIYDTVGLLRYAMQHGLAEDLTRFASDRSTSMPVRL